MLSALAANDAYCVDPGLILCFLCTRGKYVLCLPLMYAKCTWGGWSDVYPG